MNFFDNTPNDYAYIERRQTIDIILNNIFWRSSRETEIIQAFSLPDSIITISPIYNTTQKTSPVSSTVSTSLVNSSTRTLPTTSTTQQTSSTTMESISIRLPSNLIQPINYNLNIKTYFDPFDGETKETKFEGRLILTFRINRITNFFRMHADTMLNLTDTIFKIQNIDNNKDYVLEMKRLNSDLLSFSFKGSSIQIGKYEMILNFQSKFSMSSGFYLSKYNENGVAKYVKFLYIHKIN